MKQTLTDDELKFLVRQKVIEFVGSPNTDETKDQIRDMLLELVKAYPTQLDVIGEALIEGSIE